MTGIVKSITRILAFVGKEIVEVFRRPGAIVSLILGPFLVMAIFGLGYNGFKKPLQTVVVAPESAGLPNDQETYQEMAGEGFEIVAVYSDRARADALLADRSVDVVVIAPGDVVQRLLAGQQSQLEVEVNVVDPVQANYAVFLSKSLADGVNRELIRRAAQQGEAQVVGPKIPADVIAQPTIASVTNIAPITPTVTGYFGPAVLALILQHMAVTLIALSVVRERSTGIIELFRIAPVNAWEIVVGKILGYGALCAAIAATTVALLVGVLGVPNSGDPGTLAGIIGLLVLASLGLGLFIAIVSDSERQAVQLSLLVLLASVFFSGFVLPISEFTDAVKVVAYALPVTHGIRLIQDLMLRGELVETWEVGVLAVEAAILLVLCWVLLRRGLQRA